eukprot:TRINITY_DN1107_c1_g1_i1.p1 TRINITY_DN1107_c1_g1~~TRINITY_DN1107_c1_g1_i1.p1  ORF type:complete len:451 (-),score=43.08 TRINITY_DN1107_c1_g1_i1:278-1630(-)
MYVGTSVTMNEGVCADPLLDDGVLVDVFSFLGPAELTKAATLCVSCLRCSGYDALWKQHLPSSQRFASKTNLKKAFVNRRRVLCVECRDPTKYVFPLVGVRLCPTCERGPMSSRGCNPYELCSKSDAKQLFLLEARELRALPSILRSSPWQTRSSELRLFLRSAVEECALKKFGGLHELQEQRRRRHEDARRAVRHCTYDVRLPKVTFRAVTNSSSGSGGDGGISSGTRQAFSEGSETSSVAEQSRRAGSDSGEIEGDEESRCESASNEDSGEKSRSSGVEDSVLPPGLQGAAVAPDGSPSALGLQVETKYPFTVRHVAPNSFAARAGVQVGDSLLAVAGRSCSEFAGGWPAVKQALARRPITLRFQRTYHEYQRSARAPRRGRFRATASRTVTGQATSLALHDAHSETQNRDDVGKAVSSSGFGAWARHQPWLEVDYLAMGVSGLEVRD